MPTTTEEFVRWYLRFNGYFGIENFVVHDAKDQARIDREGGKVPEKTECDILGVRLPYSQEVAGDLYIANHEALTDGAEGRTDLVICDAKTGKDNQPGPVWVHAKTQRDMVRYILRFFGVLKEGDELEAAVDAFATTYRYEDGQRRIRYIIFSKTPDERHRKRGVTYITYSSIIQYIAEIRGQSWIAARIGVASHHQQWSDLIRNVFAIVNNDGEALDEKVREIAAMLGV
jgi:hypothetical protein